MGEALLHKLALRGDCLPIPLCILACMRRVLRAAGVGRGAAHAMRGDLLHSRLGRARAAAIHVFHPLLGGVFRVALTGT